MVAGRGPDLVSRGGASPANLFTQSRLLLTDFASFRVHPGGPVLLDRDLLLRLDGVLEELATRCISLSPLNPCSIGRQPTMRVFLFGGDKNLKINPDELRKMTENPRK